MDLLDNLNITKKLKKEHVNEKLMSAARYVPPVFNILGLIAAIYAAYVAISHEFPAPWGWAFAPFGVAIVGIALICVVQSIPRGGAPPAEVIPVLKTGIKMGAIIKLWFVIAAGLAGAYDYWIYPPAYPGAPVGLGFEGAGGLWIGICVALGLTIIADIISNKGLSMMLKYGGGK